MISFSSLLRRSRGAFCSRRNGQAGVTLIVAMLMLVVIGLMSVSVMRGAVTTDLVANNARAQASAQQSAELALRYCERQALAEVNSSVTNFILPAASPANWNSFVNWYPLSGASATSVPADVLTSNDSSVTTVTPQCMAEKITLTDSSEAILVTARGFSPDYQADANGRTKRGSVVWLQSTLRFG